jgi:hypothetical protein
VSDLLRRGADSDDQTNRGQAERWSLADQLQVALDAQEALTNPETVGMALGMSLSQIKMPAFIPLRWLEGTDFIVPTSDGIPLRAGRLKVMPVFSDTEAVRAWLPEGCIADHPCFGPPPNGVVVAQPKWLSELRETSGAVMIVLNPAGPAGYQIDPEDGALDSVHETIREGLASAGPATAEPGSARLAPPDLARAHKGETDYEPEAVAPPPAAAELVDPSSRWRMRERIRGALDQAAALEASGREEEAVSLLAAADRLAEFMGDYLHRSEMMMIAARILETTGRRYAAGRLAHYAVLAASLSARGRLEMEAVQLRARLL